MPKTQLRSEVEIDAPLAHVYRILSDFPRYETWNPYLTSVRGELVVGRKLRVELSLPEGDSYVLEPVVTRVTEGAELRWRGRFWSSALLEAESALLLSEPRPGVTRVVHDQDFSGFFLRFAGNALTLAARGAVYMNQALKKRAETTR
jgi:hypothetical protein